MKTVFSKFGSWNYWTSNFIKLPIAIQRWFWNRIERNCWWVSVFIKTCTFSSGRWTYKNDQSAKNCQKQQWKSLAIVAYKQPISKSKLRHLCKFRSFSSEIDGKRINPNCWQIRRPWKAIFIRNLPTSGIFWIKSLTDLPKLKDFTLADQEIGEPAPIEELSTLDLSALSTSSESSHE